MKITSENMSFLDSNPALALALFPLLLGYDKSVLAKEQQNVNVEGRASTKRSGKSASKSTIEKKHYSKFFFERVGVSCMKPIIHMKYLTRLFFIGQ